MIAGLKPYPAMKDSCVQWVGQMPSEWEIRRNARIFAQRNATGFPELPILEVSLRTGVRVRDFDESSRKQVMADAAQYKRANRGDIAYNMMRMWQGAVGVAPVDGLISPAYVVARPLPGTVSKYFEYLYRTDSYKGEVDTYSRGIVKDRNRLYWEQFKQIPTLYPPSADQAAIVRFLHHVDRRIRHYILAKQKLIKLLEEQKQAIIHRAVTRGLDPDVRLKPSGVERLGDVPECWEVKRLKWVTKLQRGYDLPADQRTPGSVPVISSGGIIGTHAEARARGPGVVMGRYGSTEAVFFIETDLFWPHNTALFVTDFQGNDKRWCYYLLRTISKADYSGKSAVPGVDRKDLFDIMVAVPPSNEQRAIASWIDEASTRLGNSLDNTRRSINLLSEYRNRLIADVVNGKLDVREAAAALPEESDDNVALEEEASLTESADEMPDDQESAEEEAEA